jgi:glutamate-1-semialdehyde 2,1-aminomutase
VEALLKTGRVACVLTEPVLQNIGVVLPQPGYLHGLIELCEKHGSLCVFDEIKTGFRSSLGGYQQVAGVRPHLSVFGKAVANGYPLSVIGGRADIMRLFDDPDPRRRVLIAGTYNAHPMVCAAAIATLTMLHEPSTYASIDARSQRLYQGLREIFAEAGVPVSLQTNASAFCTYFCEQAPRDLHDILEHHDFEIDMRLRLALLDRGIYHIPIACKQGSLSYSHSDDDIARTLDATRAAVKSL